VVRHFRKLRGYWYTITTFNKVSLYKVHVSFGENIQSVNRFDVLKEQTWSTIWNNIAFFKILSPVIFRSLVFLVKKKKKKHLGVFLCILLTLTIKKCISLWIGFSSLGTVHNLRDPSGGGGSRNCLQEATRGEGV